MKNNKSYNLLMDQWIQAERENGEVIKIAPWEIATQLEDNPVTSVYFPRAYMEPILIEFLISVFQTLLLPKNSIEWGKIRENPPGSFELKNKFEPFKQAFEIFGEQKAFMQDKSKEIRSKKKRPISQLPLDGPGENTVLKNRDWFTKEDFIESICPHCAGFLLYSFQSRTTWGGRGYQASVRGPSFITTLLQGENVWETIWQNVLPRTKFPVEISKPKVSKMERLFPWMDDLSNYIGKNNSDNTYTPEDGHSLGVYWSIPVRISFEPTEIESRCDICGRQNSKLIQDFKKAPYGLSYPNVWHHPLSPYKKDEDGTLYYERVQSGLTYRNWKGLLYGESDGNLEAALPITYKLESQRNDDLRVWTYGSRLDRGNKMRDWQETVFPLLEVGEYRELFLYHVKQMIDLAEYMRKKGIKALHHALYGKYMQGKWKSNIKHRSNEGIYKKLSNMFWQGTEEEFFSQVEVLRNRIIEEKPFDDTKKEWFIYLKNSTIELYQDISSQEQDKFSRSRMLAYRSLRNDITCQTVSRRLSYTTKEGASISTLWKDEEEEKTSEPAS